MGNQYLRDTLYVQEGFSIKTEFPLTYELSLTAGIEGEQIRSSSENNLIRNSIKWTWLSGLKLDYRELSLIRKVLQIFWSLQFRPTQPNESPLPSAEIGHCSTFPGQSYG